MKLSFQDKDNTLGQITNFSFLVKATPCSISNMQLCNEIRKVSFKRAKFFATLFYNCLICTSAPWFPFTDDQHGKYGIIAMLSKKDFSSFRQSVKREDVQTQYSGRKSLLHFTVASGDAESVKHVLSLGAEVNCTTARGYTPLIVAVLQRSVWKSEHKVFYEWSRQSCCCVLNVLTFWEEQ